MKTILIDIDGVLAETHQLWLDKINERYNRNHTIDECNNWSFHIPLNLDESIYKYWDEPGHFEFAPLVDGAQEGLEKLWFNHNCYIVGAASYQTDAIVQKWRWLNKHFPFIKKEQVVFAKDKSVVHGDYLIDDSIENAIRFVNRENVPDRKVLLFDRPWNLEHSLSGNKIHRVSNWHNILNYFKLLN